MKKFLLVLTFLILILLGLPATAPADVDMGIEAYNLGEYKMALEELLPAAQAGDARAQGYVGVMFQEGQGVEKSFETAARWFKKAAGNGDAQAQHQLGRMYYNGQGMPKDHKQAARWFRKAADQGYASAEYSLGFLYDTGQGVAKNKKQAFKWYGRAGDQGHAKAQYFMGWMYDKGDGLPQDKTKAAKLYAKAADQGHHSAMNSLGILYSTGQGVTKDKAKAAQLYRQAAEGGNRAAMTNLGALYHLGQGVKQNDATAMKLFKKSADKGHPTAMKNLGYMYEKGKGTKADNTTAYMWYVMAAKKGKDVKSRLAKLAKSMTPQQVARAREMADQRLAGKKPKPKPFPEQAKRKPKPEPQKPKKPGKRKGVLSEGGGGMPMETETCKDPKSGRNVTTGQVCAKGDDTPYSGEAAGYWSPTQIKSLYTYTDGRMTGPYKEFYKDGTLSRQGQRVEGTRRGWFKYWHPDGKGDCTKFFANDNKVTTYPFDYDPAKAKKAGGKGIQGVKNLSSNIVDKSKRSPWDKYKNLTVTTYDTNNGWYVFNGLTVAEMIKAVGAEPDKSYKWEKNVLGFYISVKRDDGGRLSFYGFERELDGRRLAYVKQIQLIRDRKILKPCNRTGDHVACLREYFYKK